MGTYRSPNALMSYWIRACYHSLFSEAGMTIFMLTGMVGVISLTSLLMPAFLLTVIMVSILTVDFIVGLLTRPIVKVVREVPESAPPNAPVRIEYAITNRTRRPLLNLYLDPAAHPRGISLPEGVTTVPWLAPHETVRTHGYVQAERRGEFFLPQPMAASPFPFGVFRFSCRGDLTKPLVIYPQYTPLTSLKLPVGSRDQAGQMLIHTDSGQNLEFYGCREYRYGDNPRHIHNPSWARLGLPIIKEFREEYMSRVAIILDTYPKPIPGLLKVIRRFNPQFEASLSLAASVTEFLCRHDHILDFFALGKPPLRGGGGRGQGFLNTILALLARLKESEGEWPGVPNEMIMDLQSINAAVFVMLRWDDDRKEVVDVLRSAGIRTRVLYVSERIDNMPSDPDFTWIKPSQVAAGMVREV